MSKRKTLCGYKKLEVTKYKFKNKHEDILKTRFKIRSKTDEKVAIESVFGFVRIYFLQFH